VTVAASAPRPTRAVDARPMFANAVTKRPSSSASRVHDGARYQYGVRLKSARAQDITDSSPRSDQVRNVWHFPTTSVEGSTTEVAVRCGPRHDKCTAPPDGATTRKEPSLSPLPCSRSSSCSRGQPCFPDLAPKDTRSKWRRTATSSSSTNLASSRVVLAEDQAQKSSSARNLTRRSTTTLS
jgi:hypothetical protein